MKNLMMLGGLLLCAAMAGCGRPIENEAPAPAGQAAGEPAPSAPTGGAAAEVRVTLREWNVTPEPTATKAGPVTLKLENTGQEPHGLYIEGPGVDRKGPLLEPGESGELSLDLPPGEYTLFDFVKDNETAHGMTAPLVAQ